MPKLSDVDITTLRIKQQLFVANPTFPNPEITTVAICGLEERGEVVVRTDSGATRNSWVADPRITYTTMDEAIAWLQDAANAAVASVTQLAQQTATAQAAAAAAERVRNIAAAAAGADATPPA